MRSWEAENYRVETSERKTLRAEDDGLGKLGGEDAEMRLLQRETVGEGRIE